MTITSKYPGKCGKCGGKIGVGEMIEWAKGAGAQHARCAGTAAATVATPTSSAMRTITVERVGRRSYLRGDTLSVRGMLRGAGCHWDADAKAWWIGSHEEALALAERAKSAPSEAAPVKRITHCVGCGGHLDDYQQRRGFRFCSSDCADDKRLGGQSGYVTRGGVRTWHQGEDD